MKRTFRTTALTAALAVTLSTPTWAAELASVAQARQETAREVAALVGDPAFSTALRDRMHKGKASLAEVMRDYAQDGKAAHEEAMDSLRDIERQAVHLRGLDDNVDDLLELRVHGVEQAEVTDFGGFWTAAIGRNATTGEKEVVAYEPSGREHRYSIDTVPSVPMLVVDSDSHAATVAGTMVLNEALRAARAPTFRPFSARNVEKADVASAPEQLTLLKSIFLVYDEEPNISGAAEVFAIVSGVGPDGTARITVKDMPWLDHDKRWYHPGMDLINWTDYGTNYVNVQLFEDDGDTNYKNLAKALTSAVGTVAKVVSPAAPEAAIVAAVSKIGETIVDALPDSPFQNDTDYLDSFYIIERDGNYGNSGKPLIGAANNARMVLEPYTVKGSR